MKKIPLSIGLVSLFLSTKAQKFEWASNMGGSLSTIGTSIAVDNLNNVYTVGTFNGIADLDPSNLVIANVTANGGEDIFITKFNSKGEYIWGKSIGGTGTDLAHHIKLDAAGNPYIIGSYEGAVDFDPSTSGTTTLTANGSSDIFVMKMYVNVNLQWSKYFGGK
ncbi:MAG: SBBP repeat-containing protein, partial [Chitinophagaceae bacterium]|nr:SBBP repeat-containing protein [Chitinophagaceae bacterium]